MEFWGVEIKPGKPLKVEPDFGYGIHVSQIALAELKMVKEDEKVTVYVTNCEDKSKFIIGTLSQKFPQVSLDLFFMKDFELSHNSESSVSILGYQTPMAPEHDEEIDSGSELEKDVVYRDAPKGQKCGFVRSSLKKKPEENESISDEMGSDEDDSDDEEVEDKASLKVEPPSKKRANDEAVKNTAVAVPNKSSGGDKCRCIGRKRC